MTSSRVYDPDRFSNQRLRDQLAISSQQTFPPQTLATNAVRIPEVDWANARAPQNVTHYDQVLAPGDLVGYQAPPPFAQAAENQQINQKDLAVGQAQIRQTQNQNEVRNTCVPCQTAIPDLKPMGCAILGGTDVDLSNRGRESVIAQRPAPGLVRLPEGQGPVFITEPNYQKNGVNPITPMWGSYNRQMYQTPYDRTENLESTGFFTNPYTGVVSETFERAMPPPTTSKYTLTRDQLKRTNPQLIWLNGGIDPNAPAITKRETPKELPGVDGGRSPWGEQLYTDQIGRRQMEYAKAALFMNRNGDLVAEKDIPKQQPAGFVGLQDMVRAFPWLPPTNMLDEKGGYLGPLNDTYNLGNNPIEQAGTLTTTKWDMSTVQGPIGPVTININPVTTPMPDQMTLKPTWRGAGQDTVTLGVDNTMNMGLSTPQDLTARTTLKEYMEAPTREWLNAQAETLGGQTYTLDIRPSLKETMEGPNTQYYINANRQELGTEVRTVDVRVTNKGLQEIYQGGGSMNAHLPVAPYIVSDNAVRFTLKELEEDKGPYAGNINALQNEGDYIPFQGALKNDGTRRQYYSADVVTLPAHLQAGDLTGDNVGPHYTTTRKNFGFDNLFHVEPSRVPNAAGSGEFPEWRSNPLQTRDYRKWVAPSEGPASYEQGVAGGETTNLNVPRFIPHVSPPCNKEPQCESFELSLRPNWFLNQVAGF